MPQNWETLERIFSEALELREEQRVAFIKEQSGDDTWLLRELETLLAVSGAKADRAFDSRGAVVQQLLDALDTEFAVGRELGGYRIESLISAGGMGVVYKALAIATGEPVALKLLPPGHCDNPERIRRLAREARALESLGHPGIVKIKEYSAEPGQQFIVMELVHGETLQALLEVGGIELARALEWGVQIAEAMQAAHVRGVAHRDLKPANVMIESATGRVKLLDFGLALLIAESPNAPHTQTTVEGTVAGTLPYFSPEQARGSSGDERSDIFSLGAVFFEMVAGRRAFDRQGAVATAAAVLSEPPDPLPESVPRPVKALIERCLQKDPANRFATMQDVTDELRRLQDLECRGRLRAPLTASLRKRIRTVVGAAIAIAAIGIAGWLWREHVLASQPRSIAVLPFANANGDPASQYLVDGLTEELTNELARSKTLRVVARSSAAMFRKEPHNVRDIGRQLHVTHLLEASVQHSGDSLSVVASLVKVSDGSRLWTNTYHRQIADLGAIQADLTKGIRGSLRVARMDERNKHVVPAKAHDYFLKARFEADQWNLASNLQAQNDYRRAIEIDARYALAYSGLGAAIWNQNAVAGQSPLLEERRKAEQAWQKALEIDPNIVSAHSGLALFVMQYDWDWNRAERELKAALSAGENVGAESNYALLCLILGRRAEADEHEQRARDLDPVGSVTISNAALFLGLEGRFAEQRAEYQKLLERTNGLAPKVYINVVRAAEGESAIAIKNLLTMPQDEPMVRMALATVEGQVGARAEALRILAPLEQHFREGRMLHYWFAQAHAAMGDEAGTIQWLKRAADAREYPAIYLHVEPAFASMQNRPDFRALKKRMGLDW